MSTGFLSRQQEIDLARAWRGKSCQKSREQLTKAYNPLIRSMARHYLRPGVLLEDLEQEGRIGFMSSLDNFDPELGHSVATLARYHIAARLQLHINDFSGVIRLPNSRKMKRLVSKCVAQIKLQENLEARKLTDSEKETICSNLGYSYKDVQEYEQNMKPPQSLSQSVRPDSDQPYDIADDTVGENETLNDLSIAQAAKMLRTTLERLEPRKKTIILMRHMNDEFMSLEDIAKTMNISRERVRLLEIEALNEIRKEFQKLGLKNLNDILS